MSHRVEQVKLIVIDSSISYNVYKVFTRLYISENILYLLRENIVKEKSNCFQIRGAV